MSANYSEPALTSRQLAFELASGITAGVGIMIDVVRQLYVATVFTLVTTAGYAKPVMNVIAMRSANAGRRYRRTKVVIGRSYAR